MKNDPIIVNADGGAQSKVGYAFNLVPANALLAVARIFQVGAARYARNNWRKIKMFDHLNHAVGHIFLYMSGDRTDDHLEHAGCRVLMAIEMRDDKYDFAAFEPLPEVPSAKTAPLPARRKPARRRRR